MNVQPRELGKHYRDVRKRLLYPKPPPRRSFPWSMRLNHGAVRYTYGAALPFITIERVIRAVCQHFNLPRVELLSPYRGKKVATPRHVAAYICQKYVGKSLSEIARWLGRDHSTIISSIARVSSDYHKFRDDIAAIVASLGLR
jgi:hypothetical protein